MPQPDFKVGDMVWLNSKNVKTNHPTKKLDYKKLGPFKILEQVNNCSFHLDLPHDVKIHPVFHVSLLECYVADQIPGRTQPPPPPVIIQGEEEFEVKEIVDSQIV